MEEKYENFCKGCEKMTNASGQRGETENTYDNSSIKRVTRKFHPVVVQNNGKEMYKKSVLHVKSVFFSGGGGVLIWSYDKKKRN